MRRDGFRGKSMSLEEKGRVKRRRVGSTGEGMDIEETGLKEKVLSRRKRMGLDEKRRV